MKKLLYPIFSVLIAVPAAAVCVDEGNGDNWGVDPATNEGCWINPPTANDAGEFAQCVDEGNGDNWGVNPATNEGCWINPPTANDAGEFAQCVDEGNGDNWGVNPATNEGCWIVPPAAEGEDDVPVQANCVDEGNGDNWGVNLSTNEGCWIDPSMVEGGDNGTVSDTNGHPFVGDAFWKTRTQVIDVAFKSQLSISYASWGKKVPVRAMIDLMQDTANMSGTQGWAEDVLSEDEIVYQDSVETGTYVDPDTGYEGTYTYVHNYATNTRRFCPEGGTVFIARAAYYSPASAGFLQFEDCQFDGKYLNGTYSYSLHHGGSRGLTDAVYMDGSDELIIPQASTWNNGKTSAKDASVPTMSARGSFGDYNVANYKMVNASSNYEENSGLPVGGYVSGVAFTATDSAGSELYRVSTELENGHWSRPQYVATAPDGATMTFDFDIDGSNVTLLISTDMNNGSAVQTVTWVGPLTKL